MKRYQIKKTVSTNEWKPKGIWQRLETGLRDSTTGINEAVKEAYAAVSKTVDENLTAQDVLGLHHEVTDTGDVVLNKFALAKAVTEVDKSKLTDEQKRKAKMHLLSHYQELEEEPPESLVGEMASVMLAKVSGEMAVEDVPVAPGVDLDALLKDDDDPFQVVVEIPACESKRGWDYLPRSIQDIVEVAASEGLPGYTGHQDADRVDWEFRVPVTHWVGATWKDGVGYFRGVIDKSAKDLKRWLRAKVIRDVSIWGAPKLAFEGGKTKVIGYNPISIDWTPPRRAGMPTRVVAMGEMDGSHEELRDELERAVYKKLGIERGEASSYAYVERVYDSYAIVHANYRGEESLFKVDYAQDGENVVLGTLVEVDRHITFVPKANEEGSGEMDWKEALAVVRTTMAKKEVDLKTALSELGFTSEQVVEQLAGEQMTALKADGELMKKLAEALGVTPEEALTVAGEMASVWRALSFDQKKPEKPAEFVGEMAEARTRLIQQAQEKILGDTINEKVSGEQAQMLVKRLLQVPEDATKEQISGEIDKLLEDPAVKGFISKSHTDQGTFAGGSSSQKKSSVAVKRVSI